MALIIENQEIHKTVISFDEMFNQSFYETLNSRTTSSLDLLDGEHLFLNFKVDNSLRIKNFFNNSKDITLSNQSLVKKFDLPEYFLKNKQLIRSLYDNIKANKNIQSIDIDRNVMLITDYISELNFEDIHLEITNTDIIKFTTVFDDNKILIISKDVSDTDTDIIYSYFINRQLIASDVADISIFTKKFKEYLCL